MKRNCLSYDDVLLVPQYSDIRTRTDIDLSANLGVGLKLNLVVFNIFLDDIDFHISTKIER